MAEHLSNKEIWRSSPWQPGQQSWLRSMRLPLFAAVVNYFVSPSLGLLVSTTTGLAAFNSIRLCIMLWAGYAVARGAGAGHWRAACAGIAIMVIDHIVLKGGTFLIQHFRGLQVEAFGQNSYLLAFGGVLVSFVMFCPLAGLLGFVGGVIGRRTGVRHAT